MEARDVGSSYSQRKFVYEFTTLKHPWILIKKKSRTFWVGYKYPGSKKINFMTKGKTIHSQAA